MEKPEFKTLKSYSVDFGTRNFVELALKEAREGSEANQFISISKGYTDQEGRKHYKRSLGFAIDAEVVDFFIKTFPEIKKEVDKLGKPAKKEAKNEDKEEKAEKKPAKKKKE